MQSNSSVISIPYINEKQKLFLESEKKYIGYGGARGGGKSWAVRTKSKLLCLNYDGIKVLIVRRSYPELTANHIDVLRVELAGIAKYNKQEKMFTFGNGSTISFRYCAKDSDLDNFQGSEYDCIFLDEATQLSEHQFEVLRACLRGVNNFPKRMYLTCNPGGQGHAWVKRLFIDRRFKETENPDDYVFIQAKVKDNKPLMENQPDYVQQLEGLTGKLKKAWLDGDWNIFEGQFFEDFVDNPNHYEDRQYTNVIKGFEPPADWKIYRSYDFGYSDPFSCGWWAVDYDGRLYRILELYGCVKNEPDTGVKWTPEEQFAEISRIEHEHPWLKGKVIHGVADPSIWDGSKGVSTADVAKRYGIYFTPGVNARIPGWMQMHYRFAFDENGYPMMYVFDSCKHFIRTIPTLIYSETKPEDLDTELEDHIADETRYMCMARPIKPVIKKHKQPVFDDPLDLQPDVNKYYRKIEVF
jgi:hypothetical protein